MLFPYRPIEEEAPFRGMIATRVMRYDKMREWRWILYIGGCRFQFSQDLLLDGQSGSLTTLTGGLEKKM